MARYFDEFIPAAIQVARSLRERKGPERFVWTTGSWLIYEYLEQAEASGRRQMEQAITQGDIAWHALPFTTHTELMTAALFRHGLSLSKRLDQRFGRTTIAAKMTDVPGHTRAVVPLLAEAGVELLHIGVNPASTAPAVPKLFRWQHPDGSCVNVIYDRGDYGQTSIFPEAGIAVCFAHTRDNERPQCEAEVLDVYSKLSKQFPATEIVGSNLCALAHSLRSQADVLVTVTAEIGDSWIHGAASDPPRLTPYRAAARLHDRWLQEGGNPNLDRDLDRFARHLIMVPEHTWGLMMEALDDETTYEGLEFEKLRLGEPARTLEASWCEQRQQITQAIQSLPDNLRSEAEREVAESQSKAWDSAVFEPTVKKCWSLEHFEIAVNEAGALCQLRCKALRQQWAEPSSTLGLFTYESFSAVDVCRFFDEYVTLDVDWARRAFCKEVSRSIVAASWSPQVTDVFTVERAGVFDLLLEMVLPDDAVQLFGAPRRLQALWSFPSDEPRVEFSIQWFGKTAIRLPTAAWIGFVTPERARGRWQLHKLDDWIAPDEVIQNGGRMLHGINSGVRYLDDETSLSIESLDACVVSPAERGLLRFDQRPQSASSGMHFCLWNNVWNTNFPLWHDRDERFRFTLRPVLRS